MISGPTTSAAAWQISVDDNGGSRLDTQTVPTADDARLTHVPNRDTAGRAGDPRCISRYLLAPCAGNETSNGYYEFRDESELRNQTLGKSSSLSWRYPECTKKHSHLTTPSADAKDPALYASAERGQV